MSALRSARDLSREELFDLVWSAPMTRLAQRFGLSDQGLRKVCLDKQVPLPKAGHWTKVAIGRTPSRPTLRPFSEVQQKARAAEQAKRRQTAKVAQVSTWQPPIPDAGAEKVQWHPLVREIKRGIDEYAKKMIFAKKVHDWEASHPGKLYPSKKKGEPWFHPTWDSMRSGGQLVTTSHRVHVMRVSLPHHERALRLLNALVLRAVELGYSIDIEEGSRSVLVSRGHERAHVRMLEKLRQVKEE